MKIHSFIFWVGLLSSLLLAACHKDDGYYAGESRLQGTVYYENGITGTLDTAYKTQLRLYLTSTGADTTDALVYSLVTGRFDIPTLDGSKKYTLLARLDKRPGPSQPVVVYQVRRSNVSTTGSIDTIRLILRPVLTGQTGLRLQVTDAMGSILPQTQIYLFADSTTYKRNRGTGSGSIASGLTNSQGKAIFLNLQARTYYASILRVAGNDTLSNSPSRRITPLVALSASPTIPPYTTALSAPPLPNAPALRLTITDANGYLLPNSRVCLYSAASQIQRKKLGCVNSLYSSTSDAQGQVLFRNLQARSYYVLAVNILGTDTLTNQQGNTVVGPLPATGTFTPAAIQLRP